MGWGRWPHLEVSLIEPGVPGLGLGWKPGPAGSCQGC